MKERASICRDYTKEEKWIKKETLFLLLVKLWKILQMDIKNSVYLKYNAIINNSAIDDNLKRITNQIYRLLPVREEGGEWKKPLITLIEELSGMDSLLIDQHTILFSLLCKLEGLLILDEDFQLFRRTIFESLNLVSNLREQCQD